jgi:hypothetical protein
VTFGPHWRTPGWACNIQLGVVMQLRGIGSAAMVEILKFVRPETAFDPESIQVLASALDEAWSRIEQSGSQFARPAYSRAMREVIAKRILEMAQQGVRDQQTLVDDAVRFVAANYKDVGKQPA